MIMALLKKHNSAFVKNNLNDSDEFACRRRKFEKLMEMQMRRPLIVSDIEKGNRMIANG